MLSSLFTILVFIHVSYFDNILYLLLCLLVKETGRLPDAGKMHHHSIVSLFESHWSTLQMVVLREILLSAVRAGDPLAAWSAAARLLRWHYPLITPSGQNGLANSLANSADRLPSGTRCADPALPFVRYVYQQSTFLLSEMFCLCTLTIMKQPNLVMLYFLAL